MRIEAEWIHAAPVLRAVSEVTRDLLASMFAPPGTIETTHLIKAETGSIDSGILDPVVAAVTSAPDTAVSVLVIEVGIGSENIIQQVSTGVPWNDLRRLARVLGILSSAVGLFVPIAGPLGSIASKAADEAFGVAEGRDKKDLSLNYAELEAWVRDAGDPTTPLLLVVKPSTSCLREEGDQLAEFLASLAAMLDWAGFATNRNAALLSVLPEHSRSLFPNSIRTHLISPMSDVEIEIALSCSIQTAKAVEELTSGRPKLVFDLADAVTSQVLQRGSTDVESLAEALRTQWTSVSIRELTKIWPNRPATWALCFSMVELTSLVGGIASLDYLRDLLGQEVMEIADRLNSEAPDHPAWPINFLGPLHDAYVPKLVRLSFRSRWQPAARRELAPSRPPERLMKALEAGTTMTLPTAAPGLRRAALAEFAQNAWLLGRDDIAFTVLRRFETLLRDDKERAALDLAERVTHPGFGKESWEAIDTCLHLLVLAGQRQEGPPLSVDLGPAVAHLRRMAKWPSARKGLLFALLTHPELRASGTEVGELLASCGSIISRTMFAALMVNGPTGDTQGDLWLRAVCIHLIRMHRSGDHYLRDSYTLFGSLVKALHNDSRFDHNRDCTRFHSLIEAMACTDLSPTRAASQCRLQVISAYAQGRSTDVIRWVTRLVAAVRPDFNDDAYAGLARLMLSQPEFGVGVGPLLLRAAQISKPLCEAYWWWYIGESQQKPGMSAMGRMLAHWVEGSRPDPLIEDWSVSHPLEPITGFELKVGSESYPIYPSDRDYILVRSGCLSRDQATVLPFWRRYSCDETIALRQMSDSTVPEGCDVHDGTAAAIEFGIALQEVGARLGIDDYSESAWQAAVMAYSAGTLDNPTAAPKQRNRAAQATDRPSAP